MVTNLISHYMTIPFPPTIFSDMSTYVGEWSLAVTDCQKYLHGGFALPYIPPGNHMLRRKASLFCKYGIAAQETTLGPHF